MRTLADGPVEAGEHVVVWDGRDNRGEPLASGVYYYALNTEAGSQGRKALLLK